MMGEYMNDLNRRFGFCLMAAMLALTGCSTKSLNRAPVEDRTRSTSSVPAVTGVESVPVKQPQGFENAGKPGYYTVKPGDTLTRIALDHGQGPQDIARWSHVENPNRIEVGQVLRVVPPVETGVVVKPVSKPVVAESPASVASSAAVASAPASAVKPAAAAGGEINWIWPANGPIVTKFDEVKSEKGIDIAGNTGDAVLAAADGRVIYVGAGIRRYGNLILLKHKDDYLTAYGHNETVHVKEDQFVLKGQKIAEMGSSGSDRVKLHFEIRRDTRVFDPLKFLPAR
jgi:lipoprotein NlpD